MKSRTLFLSALGAMFAVWFLAAAFNVCGQRKLFLLEGEGMLGDFWMPRMCLEQGYVGHPERYAGLRSVMEDKPIEIDERDVVQSDWYTDGEKTLFVTGWQDKVYPRIALVPFSAFPATFAGAYLWGALAAAVFLVSLCLIARSPWPVLLAMGMPFLFNLERGNPVWLSAACVGVFLAWRDAPSQGKRLAAAVCLAFAGALKIAPLALAALYLPQRRWRPVVFVGVLSAALIFVPWLFDKDGFAGLMAMMHNAAEHATTVLRGADFGLVQQWRSVRIVLGQDVESVWPGMMAVARASQILGLLAIAVGALRRDGLLAAAGMIHAAGNMYYYAALYLYPALVLEFPSAADEGWRTRAGALARIELMFWLALLCPLQVIIMGHSANQVIGGAAVLGLMAIRTIAWREDKVEKLKS